MSPFALRLGLLALAVAVCSEVAGEQVADEQRAVNTVLIVAPYMDQCVRADDLLRSTCAKIQHNLSPKNRANCELPAASFRARTAAGYGAFRASYRAEFDGQRARIDAALRESQQAFDHQFEQVRAGKVSMFDLETLNRLLNDTCATVEHEWLQSRKPQR